MSNCKKMSRSEAGRLGGFASADYQHTQRQQRVDEYKKDPTRCLFCKEAFAYKKRHNKFCNKSCAASHNNLGVRRYGNVSDETKSCKVLQKRVKRIGHCLNCNVEIKYSNKYCSNPCQLEYQMKQKYEGKDIFEGTDRSIKHYLLWKRGNKCDICRAEEWMGGTIPLVLDHINGDSSDNRRENLRLVCGNCDMQLPTYKGKNAGNGRAYRRKRYAEGKSY